MYCDLFGKNTGCGEFPPGELGLGLGLGIHQGEISSERIGWGRILQGGILLESKLHVTCIAIFFKAYF